MKLLIRGGRISAGFGVRKSYVDIVRNYYTPRGVERSNRSRAQETSFPGMWSYSEDIDPYRPTIPMLHFGIDDVNIRIWLRV
jgi:hypothetical protein